MEQGGLVVGRSYADRERNAVGTEPLKVKLLELIGRGGRIKIRFETGPHPGGPHAPASTDVTVTPVLVATRAERRRLIARGHPESHAGEALSTEQSLSEP